MLVQHRARPDAMTTLRRCRASHGSAPHARIDPDLLRHTAIAKAPACASLTAALRQPLANQSIHHRRLVRADAVRDRLDRASIVSGSHIGSQTHRATAPCVVSFYATVVAIVTAHRLRQIRPVSGGIHHRAHRLAGYRQSQQPRSILVSPAATIAAIAPASAQVPSG